MAERCLIAEVVGPNPILFLFSMDILGDIAEAFAKCGCLRTCDFLRRVQSEVTQIVEYQEER